MQAEQQDPTRQEDAAQRPSLSLRGTLVSPGMAFGPAYFPDRDLESMPVRRVPKAGVEGELNRLHKGLQISKDQLTALRDRLTRGDSSEQIALIDSKLERLKDAVFLADVENLILSEQMALEGAIAKVILDFDRISRLVENDVLRDRAADLREVGVRVLRNLEQNEESGGEESAANLEGPPSYVLIARELTATDVFGLAAGRVQAVVTEQGSLTGQAAILMRSLRIPTLTSVEGLFESVRPGDELLVDATDGCVHVRPDARLLEQFHSHDGEGEAPGGKPIRQTSRTADDQHVEICATCGNLPEVDSARDLGMRGVGLYRTELLFLLDSAVPGANTIEKHYRSVLESARGEPVTFRLADLDSSMGLNYLHTDREPNPALGQVGIRNLLRNPNVLRRQLTGILRAAHGYKGDVGIAVPKVADCGELRRVKEYLFEERYALERAKQPVAEHLQVGVVIETPASVFGVKELADEADFLVVALDTLQQYVLAADRDEPQFQASFERIHPFVLRALTQVAEAANEAGTPLRVFGVTVAREENVGLLLAAGYRQLCVAPVAAGPVDRIIQQTDLKTAKRLAARWRGLPAPDTWKPA
ncbi:MAG: phosphoenolpyruvate--protein phosphotransferase [Planctomycetes bacterium]|nr:phosphoenolpyruvate--protein phosphotransferase [Planctomycetota bacterium]